MPECASSTPYYCVSPPVHEPFVRHGPWKQALSATLQCVLWAGPSSWCCNRAARLGLCTLPLKELFAPAPAAVFEGPLDMVLQMLRAVDSPTDPLSLEVLESNMRSGE